MSYSDTGTLYQDISSIVTNYPTYSEDYSVENYGEMATQTGAWTKKQISNASVLIGTYFAKEIIQLNFPSDTPQIEEQNFFKVIESNFKTFVNCLVAALSQKYSFVTVTKDFTSGESALDKYKSQAIACKMNVLFKKANLTASVFKLAKAISNKTQHAQKFLTCLDTKTLSNTSEFTEQDKVAIYNCEVSTGVNIGFKPPLAPITPAKGGEITPWYARPLIWVLIVLGLFLLVILIVIFVSYTQNNKTSSFSWRGSYY